MKNETHVRAVIFDVGRVLVDVDISRGIFALFTDSFSEKTDSPVQRLMTDALMVNYNTGRISPKQFHKAVCDKFGLKLNFSKFVELWCDVFCQMPGAEELLKEMYGRVRLGLLTDTDQLHWDYVSREYSVLNHIQSRTLSYRIGVVKPSPESYLTAARSLNTPPEACLYIDDLAVNVEGARQVGMEAIQFRGVVPFREQLARKGIIKVKI